MPNLDKPMQFFFLYFPALLDGNNGHNNVLPSVIQSNASNLDIYECWIKLDPIEEVNQEPKLPLPHLSAHQLIPHKAKASASLKSEDQPTTNAIAAITHNLNNIKTTKLLQLLFFRMMKMKLIQYDFNSRQMIFNYLIYI